VVVVVMMALIAEFNPLSARKRCVLKSRSFHLQKPLSNDRHLNLEVSLDILLHSLDRTIAAQLLTTVIMLYFSTLLQALITRKVYSCNKVHLGQQNFR